MVSRGPCAPPLRADIDYATYEAHTTYGVIGVKVWIFKGEVIGTEDEARAPSLSCELRLLGN